ncbi:hypothetical protein Btru_065260 [Bulinus truncatus]|nr:hypothetical protein Btru_065260 [Bulinus truncatus]
MRIALSAELIQCNASDAITVYANITSSRLDDVTDKAYDHVGAMEFIVATLLVYCLLGIAGLLLLRVRRRASRSHRTVTLREEHLQQYIKQAEHLRLSGYKDKLKIETKRIMSQIETLERRKSETNSFIQGSSPEPCAALFSYSSDVITRCHVSSPGALGEHLSAQDTTLLIEETEEENLLVEPVGGDVTSPLIGQHSTTEMKLSNRSTITLKLINSGLGSLSGAGNLSGAGSLSGVGSLSGSDSYRDMDNVTVNIDTWSRMDTESREDNVNEGDNVKGLDTVSVMDNACEMNSVSQSGCVSRMHNGGRMDNVTRMDNVSRMDNVTRMDNISRMNNVSRMDHLNRMDNQSDTNNNQNNQSIPPVDHQPKRVSFVTSDQQCSL